MLISEVAEKNSVDGSREVVESEEMSRIQLPKVAMLCLRCRFPIRRNKGKLFESLNELYSLTNLVGEV